MGEKHFLIDSVSSTKIYSATSQILLEGDIMSQKEIQIECPSCGELINVYETVYHELDDELKKKHREQIAKEKRELQNKKKVIEKQEAEYQQKLSEGIQEGIRKASKEERIKLEKKIKKQAEEEQEDRIRSLQDELNEKSKQVKEINKTKADYEKMKREKDELKEKMELENQQKLNAEKERIQKEAQSNSEMIIAEKDETIKQLKEKFKEAQIKADQGSMQLQGEVQELGIEKYLMKQFPLDTIEEIKKGQRGADCLQIVHTHDRRDCGSIYYESKRTRNFSPSWIEKFKADIREKNADIGVLVTESKPSDMDRFGLWHGIVVCSFEEFKGLSIVLREFIIRISNVSITQRNKGDKMEILYRYLTSNEFKLHIEAIVEGFTQMKSDLDREKNAMLSIWKQREKQIEKVLLSTTNMYGSIKGIAGNTVQDVPLLELPSDDNHGL